MSQTPKELAEAGFFYTGRADKVVCYQCGGGLNQWTTSDNPWVEHEKFFPNCSYISLIQPKKLYQYPVEQTGVQVQNMEEDVNHLIKVRKDDYSNPLFQHSLLTCKVCISHDSSIALKPCGHLLVCEFCAATLLECPVCRCKISEFVKVYFS